MAEILDIIGPDLKVIGVADRERVHREGLWHQTFHCWLFRRKEEKIYLFFQLRHPGKAIPNRLDVTAAGHLLSGERREDGVREVEEELGLPLRPEELIHLGVHMEEMDLGEGWIDREYCHLHLHEFEGSLEDFSLQRSEVSGLFEVELSEVIQLMEGKRVRARFTGFTGTKAATGVHEERWVAREDLVPYSTGYYRLVFEALEVGRKQI